MTSLYPLILSALCAVGAIHLYRANQRRTRDGGGLSRVKGWVRRGGSSQPGDGPARPRWSRLAGALVALAAASFVLGFIPAQDFAAAWTAKKSGLLALGVADLALFGALYLEWWHGHGYHQRWTAIACGLGGLCAVITYVELPRMLAQAAKILPGTAKAAADASHRMGTGKAAREAAALGGASHSQYITFLGIAVVVAIVFVGIGGPGWARHRRAKAKARAGERNRKRGGGGRESIAAGYGGGPRGGPRGMIGD